MSEIRSITQDSAYLDAPADERADYDQAEAQALGEHVVCYLCGAERDMSGMMTELVDGGMVWICGGVDDEGFDTITDCETRRGI